MAHYYVTYDNAKGDKSTMIVEARSKKEALKNARNLCFTGSNFRDAQETDPAETYGEKRRRESYGIDNLMSRAQKEAEKIGWANIFDISVNDWQVVIMVYGNLSEDTFRTWGKFFEDEDVIRFSKNDVIAVISKIIKK